MKKIIFIFFISFNLIAFGDLHKSEFKRYNYVLERISRDDNQGLESEPFRYGLGILWGRATTVNEVTGYFGIRAEMGLTTMFHLELGIERSLGRNYGYGVITLKPDRRYFFTVYPGIGYGSPKGGVILLLGAEIFIVSNISFIVEGRISIELPEEGATFLGFGFKYFF